MKIAIAPIILMENMIKISNFIITETADTEFIKIIPKSLELK